MTYLMNLLVRAWKQLVLMLMGLFSLLRLIWIAFATLFGSGGSYGSRLAARLTSSSGQRIIFSFLRGWLPNIAISKSFVKAYPNTGSAVVTRYRDVQEVLSRDTDFEVVYEPRMRQITDGENFFLGMQNTPAYTRDVSNMRLVVRRDDVDKIVRPFCATRAEEIVAASNGRIDVPQELTQVVPAQMVDRYFGTPGPSQEDMIEWTTAMFWYLFIDLAADEALGKRALTAADHCRDYLDKTIADRKLNPSNRDDILHRCLEMQGADLPGMDDLGIRNNLIGLVIGAIPTISKASTQALNYLLDHEEALLGAQLAARADDDELMAAHIFEAMRFDPVNPVIYRRAVRDTVIARNTLRARRVKKGSMVFAANLSAMFDPLQLSSPTRFRTDRPWEDYILWGYGLHTCFGAYINRAVIPAILKPLLKAKNLRRADGDAGRLDTAGTPFPVHMNVVFDPA